MNIVPSFIRQRIAHRPNLLKIVDNIGWLFIDKILRMGVGLFVGVWIARYLGPEQFGLLNFAMAFVGLFGAIAGLGLQGIVVRDIVRDPDGARLTLGTAGILQLIGGVVSYMLVLAAITYLRPDDALARSIVAILGSMILLKASEIAVYWFESQVQSKYTVWVQNSVFLVFAAIKVGLILQQASIIAFVWVMLGEALLVALVLLTVLGLRGPVFASLRVSAKRARILLKDSWPLIISAMAVTIYMKIDQIMLGHMVGDNAVGIYSAAVRISEVWYFIPMVIVTSVFPAILEAKKQSEDLYCTRLQRLYDLMVIVSIAIAVPMTFFADIVVMITFGEAYLKSAAVLTIHIWASIFVFLGVASGKWIIAECKNSLLMERHLLACAFNVGINFPLIALYEENGAALATLISWMMSSYFYDIMRKSTKSQFAMKTKALNIIAGTKRLVI